MKQHITVEQLNELSEKGKERLREYWVPKKGDLFFIDGEILAVAFTGIEKNYKEYFDYIRNGAKRIDLLIRPETPLTVFTDEGMPTSEFATLQKMTLVSYFAYELLPLLSIGQMIQILDESYKTNWIEMVSKRYSVSNSKADYEDYDELVDALWDAIKDVLEKDDVTTC